MHKTVVLNIVGLSQNVICPDKTPFLFKYQNKHHSTVIEPSFPAVTCTAQANYYTGEFPSHHGIVGNGWYFRDECEVKFWRQSNHLVQSKKIWDVAFEKDRDFSCANLFGWYNMHSSVDYAVTPRPIYRADGLKLPDIYTEPMHLRDSLTEELGEFPLFHFWGPMTSRRSSAWIADAAKIVEMRYNPTLSLIYLPHLDYCLQKFGPDLDKIGSDLLEIDAICEDLVRFYQDHGAKVILLSEYGISPVDTCVPINKVLREYNFITVREELGKEILIPGASKAFAVADHQIAHVYVQDKNNLQDVKDLLNHTPGIGLVIDAEKKGHFHLNHKRSGELIAVANPHAWFSYPYWLDDAKAPDFARTVDIHRKPGYDPLELFLDPKIKYPKAKIIQTLAKKKLGMRYLMDVIPLETSLIKGSHGHLPETNGEKPLVIADDLLFNSTRPFQSTDVFDLLYYSLFEEDIPLRLDEKARSDTIAPASSYRHS